MEEGGGARRQEFWEIARHYDNGERVIMKRETKMDRNRDRK